MNETTMDNPSIMELVSGYDTYMTETSELDVTAGTDAPATSWYCVAAGVTFVVGATYEATC